VVDDVTVRLQSGDERFGDRPIVLDQQQLRALIVEDDQAAGGRLADSTTMFDDSWTSPGSAVAERPVPSGPMKAPNPRLAMLLSIGGVLLAGSAAALVNSQVLDGQSSGAPPTATAVSTT
jgi:hypothetical protein